MGLINGQGNFNGLPVLAAICDNNGSSKQNQGGASAATGADGSVLTAKELIEFIQVFSSTLLGQAGRPHAWTAPPAA